MFYYAGPGDDFLSQRFYFRENSEEKKKLLAFTYNKGPGTVQLTIYATTQYTPPTLAISSSERRFSNNVTVTVPPLLGSQSSGPQTIQVKHHLRRKAHSFTIRVGGGGEQWDEGGSEKEKSGSEESAGPYGEIEAFEWREGATIKPKLRRLVRLPKSALPRSGKTDEPEDVVATWKEGSVPSREGRLAHFEFTSVDAKRRLNDYGTLVAISSVLAISAIFGAGIDGSASWQQEKALEKGYQEGYWQQDDSELFTEASKPPQGPWADPWMNRGPQRQEHGVPKELF